jgi:pheromone shutdown protein TraB
MKDRMKNITLVCTVHKENGAANASNLYKILDQLQPEVIFLEVTPDDFKNYNTTPGLEPKAVLEYKRTLDVTLIPVDLKIIDKNIHTKFQRLFEVIDAHSTIEYQKKDKDIQKRVYESGFFYLNSDQCSKDHAELNRQDFKTVRKVNDPEITELYEYWISMISLRESEMINGIYEYSRDNAFQKAVFLVGAAHRDSMITKIEESSNYNPTNIEWQCYL